MPKNLQKKPRDEVVDNINCGTGNVASIAVRYLFHCFAFHALFVYVGLSSCHDINLHIILP